MIVFNPNMILNAMLQRNPNMQNNPYVQTIRSGDANRGQQIADNICKAYGKSREEMIAEAKRFFGIR